MLNPEQIAALKQRCNQVKLDFIAQVVAAGDVRLEELPLLPERRAYIENVIKNMPNPAEQADWQAIAALRDNASAQARLEELLNEYVRKYDGVRPPQNHVDEASALLFNLMSRREQTEWQQVNTADYDALRAYLLGHPNSVFTTQAHEHLWTLMQSNPPLMQRYLNDFPGGPYAAQAQQAMGELEEWDRVRMEGNVRALVDFLKRRPQSVYAPMARQMLAQKKQEVLDEMRANPGKFKAADIKGYINYGLFSEQDLLSQGIASPQVLQRILHFVELPPISQQENPGLQSLPDSTDVYLFGVPSSGKTCVLSGLLGSQRWSDIDMVAYGSGSYISALDIYRRQGMTPDRTNGNFVTLIKGEIPDSNDRRRVHRVNLVEMSGEEFANKIVHNPNQIVNFEDMGTGATDLLSNENPKVFFIVIDPSADGLLYISRYDHDGNPVIGPDGRQMCDVTSQDLVLRRLISMIMADENAALLKRVDTIHFIMTKADTLGNGAERGQRALDICNRYYGRTLSSLRDKCNRHGINAATKGAPMLHTFSLGQFHLGGIYEYNPADSDKLVGVIESVTRSVKTDKSLHDKIFGN